MFGRQSRRGFAFVTVLTAVLALAAVPTAGAQGLCIFTLGFRAVRGQIPQVVGDCLENEHFEPSTGNALQRTVGGLLVWRKADNWTAFTDGAFTWINGPEGLASRPNSGPLFPWEAAPSNVAGQPGAAGPPPPAAAAVPLSPASIVLAASLKDAPTLGPNWHLGGFEGLVSLDPGGTLFTAITGIPEQTTGSGANKKKLFVDPKFSPSLVQLRLRDGQLQVASRTMLKLGAGFTDPITGEARITGLPIGEPDVAAWNSNGRDRIGFDPNGIKAGDLTIDPRDGSYWLSEEYGPGILHVAGDGTILLRLVPDGLNLDAPGEHVLPVLPAELLMRQENRGLEGLGISPDGTTLISILEAPLANPDRRTGETSRNIRIITLDTSNSAAPRVNGMYVYLEETAKQAGGDSRQNDLLVDALAAISATRAIVVERTDGAGGHLNMVFAFDLAGATNLITAPNPNLEGISEKSLATVGIVPVTKTAVADLLSAGHSEHVEGLAIVDDSTIAVVNDDEFGFASYDANGQPVPSGEMTRIVQLRLGQPLR